MPMSSIFTPVASNTCIEKSMQNADYKLFIVTHFQNPESMSSFFTPVASKTCIEKSMLITSYFSNTFPKS